MGIRPLNDRLLVTRVDGEAKSSGGIIIPDSAKEKPLEGLVVAVGPGRWEKGERRPLDVTEGDKILFGKYSGTEIKIGGDEHLILREDDVLATILD
jgi:chaperonin GroES